MQTGQPTLAFVVLGLAASATCVLSACGAASDLTPELSSQVDASSASDGGDGSMATATPASDEAGSDALPADASASLEAAAAIDPCAGPDSGAPESAAVDAALLSGNVPPCPALYVHPNVCCTGTTCVEFPGEPFHPCGCGALTFPDPSTCCSLASGSDCMPVYEVFRNPSSCQFPCGPGATFPPEDNALGACLNLPNVAVDGGGFTPGGGCVYCCYEGGCASDIPGCDSTSCSPPPTFGCGNCPDGWQNVPGIPDLCCTGNAAVYTECYSQAGWISTRPLF